VRRKLRSVPYRVYQHPQLLPNYLVVPPRTIYPKLETQTLQLYLYDDRPDKYSNKLRNNCVLIIGGSGSIAYGVAEACLELGCTVIISSASASRIAASISSLQEAYPSARSRISGHACDLGNHETLDSNTVSLFEKAVQEADGQLDHVVYTAGDALSITPLEKATLEKDTASRYGPVQCTAHRSARSCKVS
jgi:short chain dehydrogenase